MLEIRGPVLPDYASLHPGYAGFRWLPPGEGRAIFSGRVSQVPAMPLEFVDLGNQHEDVVGDGDGFCIQHIR